MLIRDCHNANAVSIVQMMKELRNKDRDVAIFLLDHHPIDTPHITSDSMVGIGWDDNAQEAPPALRWLGDRFSPSGINSSLVHVDPDVALVLLSNKIARVSLMLEKATSKNVWAFAQPHIITPADSAKLFRYMNRYPAIH